MIVDDADLREFLDAGGAVFAIGGPLDRPQDITQLAYACATGKLMSKAQRQAANDPAEGYQ